MTTRDVVILGAGAASLEFLDIIDAINQQGRERIRCLAFLDDNPARHGGAIAGIPIEGPIENVARWRDVSCVHAIGNPGTYLQREHIWSRTGLGLDRLITLAHPTAVISPRAHLAPGCLLYAGVVVGAGASLGICNLLLPACVISHDVAIGDFSSLASGVLISSGATVGRSCYLGAGCTLIGGVRVEDRAMVGIGAVVLGNVAAAECVVGNPAHPIRRDQDGPGS